MSTAPPERVSPSCIDLLMHVCMIINLADGLVYISEKNMKAWRGIPDPQNKILVLRAKIRGSRKLIENVIFIARRENW